MNTIGNKLSNFGRQIMTIVKTTNINQVGTKISNMSHDQKVSIAQKVGAGTAVFYISYLYGYYNGVKSSVNK